MKSRLLSRFEQWYGGEWGMAPFLTCTIGLGLLIVMAGYACSLFSVTFVGGHILYWTGLIVQFLPVAIRLLSRKTTRREVIILVVILGCSLYLVRGVLYSPLQWTFSDEMQQWRSAYNAQSTNKLFQPNPILPVSPYYPGLQNAILAISAVSGLSIFQSGMVLLFSARVMLMLVLFFFFEELSQSYHDAGFATVLYMTNPAFMVWGSYIVYQSLALPMSFLAISALIRLRSASPPLQAALTVTALMGISTTIITHHITTYMMLGYLMLLGTLPGIWQFVQNLRIAQFFFRPTQRVLQWFIRLLVGTRSSEPPTIDKPSFNWQILAWLAVFALFAMTIWTIYVATVTLDYLGPQFTDIYHEFISVVTQTQSENKTYVAPDRIFWEFVVGISALLLVLGGLFWGTQQSITRYRGDTLAFSIIAGAQFFYVSLVLRFVSSRGGELFSRLWPFLFLLMAFPIANGILALYHSARWHWLMRLALPPLFVILFIGNVTIGWPPQWGRLPGPYLAGAFERSVDLQSLVIGDWALQHLGRDNIMAADFVNHHILGGWGLQSPVLGLTDPFVAESIQSHEASIIRNNNLEFMIVDRRFGKGLPMADFYYGPWEPSMYQFEEPLSEFTFRKFDILRGSHRIYDNGAVIFYDIRGWHFEPPQ